MAIVWETISDGVRSKDGRFYVLHGDDCAIVGRNWWLVDHMDPITERCFETAELAKEKAEEILFCEDVYKKYGLIVCDGVYRTLKDWAAEGAAVINRDTIRDKVTRFEANDALAKEW